MPARTAILTLFLCAWSVSHTAASNCAVTSTGLIPLTDPGPALYQGYERGLYPGGALTRPIAHEQAGSSLARIALRDSAGQPDALAGKVVLLTIGMSNTSIESQSFIQIAGPGSGRNPAVVIVNGAQGGWTGTRVADPAQNALFWTTVDQRLAAAGVTGAQVSAVWLKEAESGPTQAFPQDAQILQANLEAIARIIRARYPNAAQLYGSSRIYAGYATTSLNPEPYAYQSGFSVQWMVGKQLSGAPSLAFDPAVGPVVVPWISWGPYLWADGMTPRAGDGLIWECADLRETDGTHPSASGSAKVAGLLLDFFLGDSVASRWFADCSPGDPDTFSIPQEALDVVLRPDDATGEMMLQWQGLAPSSGSATTHDVAIGALSSLAMTGWPGQAACAAPGVGASSLRDLAPLPPLGEGIWYLIRGRNACAAGSYGSPALDAASPCPN